MFRATQLYPFLGKTTGGRRGRHSGPGRAAHRGGPRPERAFSCHSHVCRPPTVNQMPPGQDTQPSLEQKNPSATAWPISGHLALDTARCTINLRAYFRHRATVDTPLRDVRRRAGNSVRSIAGAPPQEARGTHPPCPAALSTGGQVRGPRGSPPKRELQVPNCPPSGPTALPRESGGHTSGQTPPRPGHTPWVMGAPPGPISSGTAMSSHVQKLQRGTGGVCSPGPHPLAGTHSRPLNTVPARESTPPRGGSGLDIQSQRKPCREGGARRTGYGHGHLHAG